MIEEPKTPPAVFVSYSHDSEEHKVWVREFAEALRGVGIDVILDEWEIGPGDDVPKFMEQSVRKALRVIMVCTEQYVRKADDGKGGAGYEIMVVTGELVSDLGTRKFIPIIRQSGEKFSLPACVSTRYFVDFSRNELFSEKLEELARNIHQAPRFEKPLLGNSPFQEKPVNTGENPLAEIDGIVPVDPYQSYELSISYANAGNFAKWRELVHKEKSRVVASLLNFKAENQQNTPSDEKELPEFFLPAIATYAGLFATAFGAIDSTDNRFHNQLSLLDWIRKPNGWERSGPTLWVDLPELALFTYQALLGALALSRHRPELAYSLATTVMADQYSQRDAQPLFKITRYTGWPNSLNHTCTIALMFIRKVAKEWEWLWKLFGSEEDTIAAIMAYYFFINTLDFVSAAKGKSREDLALRNLNTPLFFIHSEVDLQSRAGNLFYESAKFLGDVLTDNGISNEALPGLWDLWMQECGRWLGSVYRDHWRWDHLPLVHRDFPKMLARGPQKRLIE